MTTFPIFRLEELSGEKLERILKRSVVEIEEIASNVKRIIEEVNEKGDAAIAEFLSTQIGREVRPEEVVLGQEKVSEAYRKLEERVLRALRHMIRNAKKFHSLQMPRSFVTKIEEGVYAGQLVVPLDSAGLYVPAGKAAYPSVAIMVTVPAKVAGVKRIALASPPWMGEMTIEPATLVAAYESGAREFYVMGGAHAIAAFAYGTEFVKRVDVIAGPGGPYTYTAKLLVRDVVRTDLPAGPSEALVFADGTVPAKWVAWDVLNEAEHGPDSAALLVTTSLDYAEEVAREIDEALEKLPEQKRNFITSHAGKYSAIIVCKDLNEVAEFVNRYAPEHLVIDSKRARKLLRLFRNFGTVCLNTPSVAGSYGIGPNSTLPTGGSARLYSGLSVDVFLKKPTVEELRGAKGYMAMRDTVLALAEHEGFPAHAEAFKRRLEALGKRTVKRFTSSRSPRSPSRRGRPSRPPLSRASRRSRK